MMKFLAQANVSPNTPLTGANVSPQNITLTNPLGTSSFLAVLTNIINFLFTYIAIPLCTIMVLVGAFQLMTSSGEPEKISRGRKTILYAAIGFGVVLLAGGVTNIIKSIISP